jgi:hypothetical protein
MASRKETVKARIDEAVRPLLEPGEQVQVSAHGVQGLNPYLAAYLREAGVVVPQREYFVVLTDRRLLFIKVSFWRTQGKGLAFADPRPQVSVVRFKRRLGWALVKLKRPDQRTIRLNFRWRLWGEEAKALSAALGGVPVKTV